ncbi:mannosyltransferase putative-domain-containing protein [Obelidium mucronatum]|nr:mannosyltransferase putative-domain-containing protein [Obelidium mucronatum]
MHLRQKTFELIRLSNAKRKKVALGYIGLFIFIIAGLDYLRSVLIEESSGESLNTSSLEDRLRQVDVAQAIVLDYFQTEIESKTAKPPKYVMSNFSLAHSFALSLVNTEYDRTDFRELARRGRAAYISFLLKKNSEGLLISIGSIQHQFDQILQLQTASVFPFVTPKFKSIPAMHESFASQDESSFGFVITCGTARFYMTYHAILSLREIFGINAPIEVHYGGDADLHPKLAEAFNKLPNVKAVNLVEIFPIEAAEFFWTSLKPFAILATSFRTAIYMDTDVLFFTNPIQILQSELFKKTGQLYYHDRTMLNPQWFEGPKWLSSLITSPSPSSKSLRYMNGHSVHEMDSSFMVVDKGRPGILFSLLLTCRMNSKLEREKTTYVKTYGDKESFWIANELLRVPFSFNSHLGGVEGRTVVCGPWLLHVNESGDPFFWNGGGVLKDRTATPQTGFEFINLEGWMMSAGEYYGEFCVRQKKELVWSLDEQVLALLERYKSLFSTDFFTVGISIE